MSTPSSPLSNIYSLAGLESENGDSIHRFWEELPCGVYSISFGVSESRLCIRGEVIKHEWRNNMWKELIEWERSLVVPRPEDLSMSSIQEEKDNALSGTALSSSDSSSLSQIFICLTRFRFRIRAESFGCSKGISEAANFTT